MKKILLLVALSLMLAACSEEVEPSTSAAEITHSYDDQQKDIEVFTNRLDDYYPLESLRILNNTLTITLNEPNLTEELAQTYAVKILEYLQVQTRRYDVEILIKSSSVDLYGKEGYDIPFTLHVSEETLMKYDFDNFKVHNLEATADLYLYYKK